MTGYGSGEAGGFKVEVRSTNHKGLHIQLSLPPYLYFYEPEIRNLVKERFQRGYIEIFFSRSRDENLNVKLNRPLAIEYYKALVSLKNELSIQDNVGMHVLAMQKDIFILDEPGLEIPVFREALVAAIEQLRKMRAREGKELAEDIVSRMQFLIDNVSRIEGLREQFTENARAALAEKMRSILSNVTVDESRLIQEIAFMVERSDITEELVRTKSHLKHMNKVLSEGDAISKKLGFLAQHVNIVFNSEYEMRAREDEGTDTEPAIKFKI
ncbi:MAG: DUF1732 domain-containing protein [Nitrospirae bacterium]|nr:DUF1732 domain-containing protein [Nitrospirota bacterium]